MRVHEFCVLNFGVLDEDVSGRRSDITLHRRLGVAFVPLKDLS